MEVSFNNKHLTELYKKGKSRKLRLQPDVVDKFIKRIAALEAADSIHDLWGLKSFNFEKLEGYENRYSVRVDRQYRLEMEIEWDDEKKTRGKITIVELSKHYGD